MTDVKPYTDEDMPSVRETLYRFRGGVAVRIGRRLLATLDERTRERNEARDDADGWRKEAEEQQAARIEGWEARRNAEAAAGVWEQRYRLLAEGLTGRLEIAMTPPERITDADCVLAAIESSIDDGEMQAASLREDYHRFTSAVSRALGVVACSSEHAEKAIASLREEVARLPFLQARLEKAEREACRVLEVLDERDRERKARAAAERRAEEAEAEEDRMRKELSSAYGRAQAAERRAEEAGGRLRDETVRADRAVFVLRGTLDAMEAAEATLEVMLGNPNGEPEPGDDDAIALAELRDAIAETRKFLATRHPPQQQTSACPWHGPTCTSTDGDGHRYCNAAGCGWDTGDCPPQQTPALHYVRADDYPHHRLTAAAPQPPAGDDGEEWVERHLYVGQRVVVPLRGELGTLKAIRGELGEPLLFHVVLDGGEKLCLHEEDLVPHDDGAPIIRRASEGTEGGRDA